MNRKRFGAESNLIARLRNKKVQPFRDAGVPCGGDCAASRWDSTARVAHHQRDSLRTGKQGLSQKLTVECPRMGHLPQSTQYRFTLSPEQGTHRERSCWAVSSQYLVDWTLRDWPDRKATRVARSSSPHYERPFSMGTSRIQKYNRAHPMWKVDLYTLVPDDALRGAQRSIEACRG